MSIAVIVDTFPRWSERFIARELNELLRRGLNLRLYCLRAGAEECAADPDFAPLMPFRVVLPFCFLPSRGSELGGDAAAQMRIEKAAEAIGSSGYRQIACANTLVRLMRENHTARRLRAFRESSFHTRMAGSRSAEVAVSCFRRTRGMFSSMRNCCLKKLRRRSRSSHATKARLSGSIHRRRRDAWVSCVTACH